MGFCPICLAVTAVQPLKPEAIEHLLNAGREFLLAMTAVLGARADEAGGKDDAPTLTRIDIGVSARRAVGVDIGGTKIAAPRIDDRGGDRSSDADCPRRRAIRTSSRRDRGRGAAVIDDDVVAIGVGVAGLVDARSGVLLSPPNFAWRNLPSAEGLGARFGLPVTVDNDATAAAWGESRLGASRGYDDSAVRRRRHGDRRRDRRRRTAPPGRPRPRGGDRPHIVEPDGPRLRLREPGMLGAGGERVGDRASRRVAPSRDEPGSTLARLAGGDPGARDRRARDRGGTGR